MHDTMDPQNSPARTELHESSGSAPSPRAIEAAWRIWKGEVTAEHATIQTVAEMATIIANIFEPTEHVCAMSCDFNGQCMVCGTVVPMREPNPEVRHGGANDGKLQTAKPIWKTNQLNPAGQSPPLSLAIC